MNWVLERSAATVGRSVLFKNQDICHKCHEFVCLQYYVGEVIESNIVTKSKHYKHFIKQSCQKTNCCKLQPFILCQHKRYTTSIKSLLSEKVTIYICLYRITHDKVYHLKTTQTYIKASLPTWRVLCRLQLLLT